MAQTIKLKRSSVSGRLPTTSDLELGEVAINTYDGKMYIKKNVGGTESIVEIGGQGGGIASSFTLYEYTATSGQTTFSGSDGNSNTLAYDTGTPPKILVYLNGVLLDHTTDYTATNGTSVVLTNGAATNDLLQIAAYKSSVSTTLDIDLSDSQKLLLGDDDDFQIYHDGSTNNSVIKETGSGNLELWGNNVKIMNVAGTETQLNANPNGQVELYYDNSKKLETTSSGIQVQGAMASTTGAYSPIYYGGSSSLQLKSNTGELFGQFTNNGAAELYYDNTKKFETSSTGATLTGTLVADSINLGDSDAINMGTSDDFQLYHDGSNSYVYDAGTGYLVLMSNGPGIRLNKNNAEVMLDAAPDGAVSLYYDNSKKFETTSTGATITGTISSGAITSSGQITAKSAVLTDDGSGSPLLKISADDNAPWAIQLYREDLGGGPQVFASNTTTWSFQGNINLRPTYAYQVDGTTVIDSSRNLTNIGTISSGLITSSGGSSGRYTGLEVVNTTNAGGTETAIGLGVVSAGNTACDVKLVANRVGANSGSDFYIEQTDSSGVQQERFRITENGNVGIGTTTPDEFSIGGSFKILSVGGDRTGVINIIDDGVNGSYLQFGTAAGLRRASIHAVNGSDLVFTLNTNNTGTGLTERMRIRNSTGNVGIGISDPDQKLDVNGNIRIPNAGKIVFGSAGASPGDYLELNDVGSSGDLLKLVQDSTTRLAVQGVTGNVSIGVTTPFTVGGTAKLSLSTANNTYLTAGASNSDLIYSRRYGSGHYQTQTYLSNNTGSLELQPYGGKVGIGTNATVSSTLQVEALGIDTTTTSTTATTQVAIDTFAAATFRSARYTIQVTNSTDSTYHLTEILLIHDGTTPQITEYGTIFTGSAEATFDADISSGNVRLLATPATTDSMTFKVVRHCITV